MELFDKRLRDVVLGTNRECQLVATVYILNQYEPVFTVYIETYQLRGKPIATWLMSTNFMLEG